MDKPRELKAIKSAQKQLEKAIDALNLGIVDLDISSCMYSTARAMVESRNALCALRMDFVERENFVKIY